MAKRGPKTGMGPVHLFMPTPMREAFNAYHASVNPYGSPSDTAREMLAAQLSADPSGAIHAAASDSARKIAQRVANLVFRDALKWAADEFDMRVANLAASKAAMGDDSDPSDGNG